MSVIRPSLPPLFWCAVLAVAMDFRMRAAAEPPYDVPPADAVQFALQGEYVGDDGGRRVGVQVAARRESRFHALVLEGGLPGAGWDGGRYAFLESGPLVDGSASFLSAAEEGTTAILDVRGFRLSRDGREMVLRRIERQSPTLDKQPPAGAVVLFGGPQPNLDAFYEQPPPEFEVRTKPIMRGDCLLGGALTKKSFRDFTMHAEFKTGWEPHGIPWRRSDGGIYMLGRYEVAVGDSFGFDFDILAPRGRELPIMALEQFRAGATKHVPRTPNVCGCMFNRPPSTVPNACLPPLVWQTFDIDFTAPRFGPDGTKTEPATISVKLNGHPTVERFAVPGQGPNYGYGKKPEAPEGPIWFEGFGRAVLYRNIWVLERP